MTGGPTVVMLSPPNLPTCLTIIPDSFTIFFAGRDERDGNTQTDQTGFRRKQWTRPNRSTSSGRFVKRTRFLTAGRGSKYA